MRETVNILDHSIVVTDEGGGSWNETALGISCISRCEVMIRPDLAPDTNACTIIHELLHIIAEIQGIQLTEQDVCSLAAGIMSMMDNEWLVKHIVERGK